MSLGRDDVRGTIALRAERWALTKLKETARHLNRGPKLPPHLQVGLRGEFEALFFLRRLGFTVIERRWQSPELNGDLDLIAWENDFLCFVEVKTRSARDSTPASLAVNPAKRRMLQKVAKSYLRTMPRESSDKVPTRFDVVSIYLLPTGVECEILREVFYLDALEAS